MFQDLETLIIQFNFIYKYYQFIIFITLCYTNNSDILVFIQVKLEIVVFVQIICKIVNFNNLIHNHILLLSCLFNFSNILGSFMFT